MMPPLKLPSQEKVIAHVPWVLVTLSLIWNMALTEVVGSFRTDMLKQIHDTVEQAQAKITTQLAAIVEAHRLLTQSDTEQVLRIKVLESTQLTPSQVQALTETVARIRTDIEVLRTRVETGGLTETFVRELLTTLKGVDRRLQAIDDFMQGATKKR